MIHGRAKTVGVTMQSIPEVLLGTDETLTYTYEMEPSVEAPVVAGETRLGTMTVLCDGEKVGETALVAKDSIEALPYPKWLSGLAWFGIHPVFVILFLFLLLLILVLYLRYRHVQKIKRKRAARRARQRRTNRGALLK